MQQKIAHYSEIISVIMHFMAAITFFVVVQIVISGELSPFYIHILFVMCFFAVIGIRLFINGNFLIYMIAHFTLYLTLLTIPIQSVMFIVFAVYLIALTMWSVSYWKTGEVSGSGQIPWVTITLFVLSYIYSFVSHHDILKNYLLVTGYVYLLLFLLGFYLKGAYDLSGNRLMHKQLPLAQIIKTNSYMIGVLLAITALAMILANVIDMDNLLYVIGDGIIAILRVLIKGFFIILTWFANLLKNMGFGDMESLWDALGKAVTEDNTGSRILNMIFSVIKIGLTVLFLMWVGRGLNIRIRRYLNDNTLPMDRVERIRSKDNGLKMIVESIVNKKSNEPVSPIRRKYKKAVRGLVLNKSVTTGQIEAQLTRVEADDMRPLKEAYERERYKDEIE